MTIAAGFVHRHGVLLATDSLMSAEQLGYYDKKMVAAVGVDYAALFAFAGDPRFCVPVVRQCEAMLNRYNGSDRTTQQIVDVVRRVWFREYRKFLPSSVNDAILAAIWTRGGGMAGLFGSVRENFGEPSSGFQCIGAGEIAADFATRGAAFALMTPESFAEQTAVAAIDRAKRLVPNYCGGDIVMVTLTDKGELSACGEKRVSAIERACKEYDESSKKLLEFLSDPEGQHEVFLCVLSDFEREVTQSSIRMRSEIRAAKVFVFPDAPCKAAQSILFEFDLSRARLSTPESTKRD